MKNSKIRVIVWIISILSIFSFIACGFGSSSKTTQMRKVDISVSIPDSLQAKLLKMAQKPDVNITKVTLDVNSSSHIYMQDAPFTKMINRQGNYWAITTDLLPIEEELSFIVKAYNSLGLLIFKGSYNGEINNQLTSINIPLSPASLTLEQTPSLRSIVFNNSEQTDITFNVYNPNGDDLSYSITPLSDGAFSPNQGTLDFSTNLKFISLNTTFTPPAVADSYSYRFTLTNSDEESFTTTFTIVVTPQKRLSVFVNMPPVIDSIDLFSQGENLTVTVQAHDTNSDNTLSYLWEKINGSATISSGTNGNTVTLSDYQPNSPVILKITVSNNKGSSVSRIFVSDGATVIRNLELKALTSIGSTSTKKLYGINGDGKITFLKDNSLLETYVINFIDKPTILDGMAYFSIYNSTTHRGALAKTDGTPNGTVIVKDNILFDTLKKINNTLFFRGGDGVHGKELWKSDGTTNGTIMVKDINPDGASNPSYLTNINGTLYFIADDGVHGKELWKSDGTDNGTVMVKDINPDSDDSNINNLVNLNGVLYFTVNNTSQIYLWKSDGTDNGTVQVKLIGNNVYNPNFNNLISINGTLYFIIKEYVSNTNLHYQINLYKSDGTDNGTVVIKQLFGDASSSINYKSSKLFYINGTLYFGILHSTNVYLYKSDGTANETIKVKDITSNSNFNLYMLANDNKILYFTVDDGVHGYELWKSNGTENGTVMVKDINPNGNSNPNYLTNINGTFYFMADENGDGQKELWKSNGTEIGTVKVTLPE